MFQILYWIIFILYWIQFWLYMNQRKHYKIIWQSFKEIIEAHTYRGFLISSKFQTKGEILCSCGSANCETLRIIGKWAGGRNE